MASELGAKQWREAVASRRGLDGSKTFVQQLTEQRKAEPQKSGETNWRGYLEMRRNMVGPDGKSRSKGYNTEPQKGGEKNKGRSLPKTSEHSDAFLKKNAELAAKRHGEAKEAAGVQLKAREETRARGYQVSAEHFQKLADKVKGSGPQKPREVSMGHQKVQPSQQGSSERAAKHAEKAKAAEQIKNAQVQQTKVRQAAPPPPRK